MYTNINICAILTHAHALYACNKGIPIYIQALYTNIHLKIYLPVVPVDRHVNLHVLIHEIRGEHQQQQHYCRYDYHHCYLWGEGGEG